MIDPVYSAVNVWVGFYNMLPRAITAIVNLALAMYIVPTILKLLFKDLR